MSRRDRFTRPVRESIREVSEDSWLLGSKLLISRRRSPSSSPLSSPSSTASSPSLPSTGTTWSDGQGSLYILSDAPDPPPPSRPLSATSDIEKVYDAGDATAVWRVGDAFCKVKIPDLDTTPEHVTLEYLYQRRPLSFALPNIYYHVEYDDRYYLITSRVAGQTLSEAWSSMNEAMEQHCVSRITSICKELAVWEADSIRGVEGQFLSEHFFTGREEPKDFSPASLLSSCKAVGMDCSTLVFYHCDLGAVNVLVDITNGSIGIIDWETAGFVPKEWMRTKFRVSSGFDLPGDDLDLRVD